MSLKSRINQIANSLGVKWSEFCACDEMKKIDLESRTVSYNPYESGRYVPYQDSEQSKLDKQQNRRIKEANPVRCDYCGKLVDKRVITLVCVEVVK